MLHTIGAHSNVNLSDSFDWRLNNGTGVNQIATKSEILAKTASATGTVVTISGNYADNQCVKYSDIILSTVADMAHATVTYYIEGYDSMITRVSSGQRQSVTLKAGTYSYYYEGAVDINVSVFWSGISHYYEYKLSSYVPRMKTYTGPNVSLYASHTINNKGTFTINSDFTISNTYNMIDQDILPDPSISVSMDPDSKTVDGNVTIGGIIYKSVKYIVKLANY